MAKDAKDPKRVRAALIGQRNIHVPGIKFNAVLTAIFAACTCAAWMWDAQLLLKCGAAFCLANSVFGLLKDIGRHRDIAARIADIDRGGTGEIPE